MAEGARPTFKHLKYPGAGSLIGWRDGKVAVPDDPIIAYIEGDGTGPDIWRATVRVIDGAVARAYGGRRRVHWFEVLAGDKAVEMTGETLPQDTLDAIRHFRVAIKGPLTTPVGKGIRSLNVSLRQLLDLYDCVRPVRYFEGVPSPMKQPGLLDVIIHRENTEDVYAGIEWAQGTEEARQLIDLVARLSDGKKKIRPDSGIGIKPISITGTKRLVRMALRDAIARGRKTVTLVHKGNIMKFTEGAFRDWGYEVATQEFREACVTEQEVTEKHGGKRPEGKVLVNDRIADSMFQQLLLRPDEYGILCTPNLNGDYLSDACAAQVGGLGIAPGANIGDGYAVFEATHGTAPKYANQDKVNPGSLILSGVMMLEYLGWVEAARLVEKGMERTIAQKRVTYDFHRLMEGATLLKCSEFGAALVENM